MFFHFEPLDPRSFIGTNFIVGPPTINIGPPMINTIPLPHFSIPTLTLLPIEYCRLVPTPDSMIMELPPFHYDIANPAGQPIELQTFKTMYNDLASGIFDGTEGIVHPLEPVVQNLTLKALVSRIDEHCVKENK